jgi:hypothetical protein
MMVVSLLLALALASAPRIAVVVVDGPDATRTELQDALAADPTVSAQPQSLVDQLLAGAAGAGLVCTLDDVSCWTKLGLDGELDQLVIAGTGTSGAFELRLVNVGTGRQDRHVTIEAGTPLDARAALASLLHPAPSPSPSPPAARDARATPPPMAQAEPRVEVVPSPAPSTSSMLLIAAGGAAVVGIACGVVAASVDVGLTEMLVAADEQGTPLDLTSYREQENTQNLLIACGAVAGVAALASAAGALVVE